MTTQTLLDFDLGESSSDSDFRIEDHDDDSDDFSASNDDQSGNSGDSDKDEDDDDDDDDDDYDSRKNSKITNGTANKSEKPAIAASSGRENNVGLIAASELASSKAKKILEGDNAAILNVSICSVCLGDRSDDANEIVECDNCGISVHEGCYGIMDSASVSSTVSSCSTEPWFCEACKANKVDPVCELCPNSGGIFKETDVGKWVHLVCALYVPGVAFGEVDQLSSVTLFEMPYGKWGAKTCSICDDGRFARSGVCIGCDAGMCKTYFHVTCAQATGLLSETHSEEADHADPFYAHCKIHSDKTLVKRRKRNYNMLRMQMNCKAARAKVIDGKNASAEQQRVERKLKKHRNKYITNKVVRNEHWVPAQKMPRLLTTSASACRKLILKAKLMDIDTAALEFQETQIASLVDIRKKWHVAPAFSVEFVGYYLDRLGRLQEMKEKLQQQLALNRTLIHDQDRFRTHYDESVNLQAEQSALKKSLCEAVTKLFDTVHALCPNKSLPAIENVYRSPKKATSPKLPTQMPSRPISVPTAAALKMGVGFPLMNLPGTSDDTNKILSTQCHQQQQQQQQQEQRQNHHHHRHHQQLNECGICKQINDQHCMAKCDTCELFYHLGCLSPPLTRHPKKSKIYGWQCSECDEDNPDGVVQLATGPRKSRTKYSKDGTIVPVDISQSVSNDNETIESVSNSLSPSSNRSEIVKPVLKIERSKTPIQISNSNDSDKTSTPKSRSKRERKDAKRKMKKPDSITVQSPEATRVEEPTNENKPSSQDSSEKVAKKAEKSGEKAKRKKKIATKEQVTSVDPGSFIENIMIESTTKELINDFESEPLKSKPDAIGTEPSAAIESTTHKPNRKRRKEKHRSKDRTDRSSSKERKKKRKRKNHDEHKMAEQLDGVPKIRIKFKAMPLPGEKAAEPQCFYVPANMVRPTEFCRSRPASVDTMNDEITSLPVNLTTPPKPASPPLTKKQDTVLSKNIIRTRRLSVVPSPAKVPNKHCATPQPNDDILSAIHMLCDVCRESGTTADQVKCDDCQKNYHFRCLIPPLKKTPKRRGYSWHCADCDPTDKEDK